MAGEADLQQLDSLLAHFLLPDNNARRQAEERIRQLARNPSVISALLHVLCTSQAPEVRQLAAVLMRKKVTGHWMKLSPEVQENVKSTLLDIIAREPSNSVRRASADVVSVIASHTVPAGKWPALLQFLLQCSQSPQEDHREVALILFSSLTETIGDILRPHFATLQAVFISGLRDQQSSRVRVAALKAVGSLVDYIESEQEVVMFRELIGPILDVARFCLANGDEAAAVKTCEIFDELLEKPSPLLGPAVPTMVQFSLEVAANPTLELSTRHQAVNLIGWLASWKPKAMVKHKMIEPILSVLGPMLATSDEPQDPTEDLSVSRFTAQVIDAMAMGLPKKHFFPPVLAFARTNAGGPDVKQREAAQMALAAVAEGCSDAIGKRLQEVLGLVLPAMGDGAHSARSAACFALGQLAEHVQPEMAECHKEVLPAIFAVLSDAVPEVQERGYYALAAFCESLGEEILPYLDPLMRTLLQALQNNSRDLQEMCLSAMGSAAAAAETDFMPYAEGVLAAMAPLTELQQLEDLSVRAKALELVGIVGLACGRECIQPHIPRFMEAALQGFAADHSELREYGHGFFAQVSQILEADFAPFLPRVVPLALASCQLDDGTIFDYGEADKDKDGGGALGEVLSDEDEEEEEEEGGRKMRNVSVRTGVLDEKAAATQALGCYALQTEEAFQPYLEPVLEILKKHATYFHEDVRLQAMLALQHVFTASLAAYPSKASPAPGGPVVQTLSTETLHVYNTAVEVYLRAADEDEDKETVAQACSSLTHLVKTAGSGPVQPYVEKICATVMEFLKGEALCQTMGGGNEDEGGEGGGGGGDGEEDYHDDAEHDELLMDAATELLPAMAEVLGAAFEPAFRSLFPEIMKFTEADRPAGDRSMAVACCAEVARFVGAPIAPYIDVLMPAAIRELRSDDPTNRRNAAFCGGVLCWHGGDAAVPHYPQLLLALHPIFTPQETTDGVRDNAAGAVARMIAARPAALPLGQVLPVLVGALPVREDMEEAGSVYGCLSSLMLQGQPEIVPLIPQLVPVFASAAAHSEVSEEVKRGIGHTLTQLLSQYPDQMKPLLEALPGPDASALSAVMGAQ